MYTQIFYSESKTKLDWSWISQGLLCLFFFWVYMFPPFQPNPRNFEIELTRNNYLNLKFNNFRDYFSILNYLRIFSLSSGLVMIIWFWIHTFHFSICSHIFILQNVLFLWKKLLSDQVSIYFHINSFIHIHLYLYVYLSIYNMYFCLFPCYFYVCMCVCMYVCMCVFYYMCMF